MDSWAVKEEETRHAIRRKKKNIATPKSSVVWQPSEIGKTSQRLRPLAAEEPEAKKKKRTRPNVI